MIDVIIALEETYVLFVIWLLLRSVSESNDVPPSYYWLERW